jgi:hypothetical protein
MPPRGGVQLEVGFVVPDPHGDRGGSIGPLRDSQTQRRGDIAV